MKPFILTSFAVTKDNVIHHTGTDRILRILMRPMSLFESMNSNGVVTLKALFDSTTENHGFSNLTITQITHTIVRAGWPASIDQSEKIS